MYIPCYDIPITVYTYIVYALRIELTLRSNFRAMKQKFVVEKLYSTYFIRAEQTSNKTVEVKCYHLEVMEEQIVNNHLMDDFGNNSDSLRRFQLCSRARKAAHP